ncbi:GNAT family N-acetyltransferase [Streptomyces microflavus]|uniref:GNAT family N-acetyltransferase n=1 Tax=Streptomyces microflavus TaxID=1919 RepID=UPI0035DCC3B5
MRSGVTHPGRGPRRPDPLVRRATARDARRLTRLVRTSRAYEGPYAPMVAGYRIGPDYIETHRVFVAADRDDGRVLGFYSLILRPPELDLMFVADEAQGLGIGRLLIGHLRQGFYRGVGAEPTGTVRANPPAVMWDRPELLLPIGR